MYATCFQIYFNDIYIYLRRGFALANSNNYLLSITALVYTTVLKLLKDAWEIQYFGVDNLLIIIVLLTVFVDTYYGVKKSIKKSKEAFYKAQEWGIKTPEYRRFMKEAELRKFSPMKLQFTFFKCFTLLGYLFFARTLMSSNGTFQPVLDFTLEVLVKVPLMIFWYYDFKSIGRNAMYLSPKNKKAPIFVIVEGIFEPRINKILRMMGQDTIDRDSEQMP